jgi:hypothetical protein
MTHDEAKQQVRVIMKRHTNDIGVVGGTCRHTTTGTSRSNGRARGPSKGGGCSPGVGRISTPSNLLIEDAFCMCLQDRAGVEDTVMSVQ